MNTETEPSESGSGLPQLVDREEVCRRLAITPRPLKRLVVERRIPHTKIGGRVRFYEADIADMLERNRRAIHS